MRPTARAISIRLFEIAGPFEGALHAACLMLRRLIALNLAAGFVLLVGYWRPNGAQTPLHIQCLLYFGAAKNGLSGIVSL